MRKAYNIHENATREIHSFFRVLKTESCVNIYGLLSCNTSRGLAGYTTKVHDKSANSMEELTYS